MIKNKERFYIFLLSLQALLICFCSPIHPFSSKLPGTDSAVFLLIGKYMSQGVMPYRDLFDHKGPLLYVINWAGMLIGFVGVWLIELFCMLISIWLCYRCARRFFNAEASFFGTGFVFVALLRWFEGGNLTEEYALPFLFGALYCLLDYFTEDFVLDRTRLFVSGGCMGGVLMLRPNMIGLWIGMCAVIFFHTLLIRKYRMILRYVLFFSFGIIASVMPFVIWLDAKDALYDCYRCYLELNFVYSESSLIDRGKSILYALEFPEVLIAASVLFGLLLTQKKDIKNPRHMLTWATAASLGMTIIMTSISGRNFGHYYMVLLPCIILPVTCLIETALRRTSFKPWMLAMLSVMILSVPVLKGGYMFWSTMKEDTVTKTLVTVLDENSNRGEPILVAGNYCRLHLLSDRPPATYFPYYTGNIMGSYIDEIYINEPQIIVESKRNILNRARKYLNENYNVVFEFEDAVVYKRI